MVFSPGYAARHVKSELSSTFIDSFCPQLKMLYVGITRARNQLWIFDKSDKSEPMRVRQIVTSTLPIPLTAHRVTDDLDCTQSSSKLYTRDGCPPSCCIIDSGRMGIVWQRLVPAQKILSGHALFRQSFATTLSGNLRGFPPARYGSCESWCSATEGSARSFSHCRRCIYVKRERCTTRKRQIPVLPLCRRMLYARR